MTDRPHYESDDSRQAEEALIADVCIAWRVTAHKLPRRYVLDYVLMREGKVMALAECKVRTAVYPDYMLAVSKVLAARQWRDALKLDAVLIVRNPDGDSWYDLCADGMGLYDFRIGGRTDRGDWQDVEPCIMLPPSARHTLDEYPFTTLDAEDITWEP